MKPTEKIALISAAVGVAAAGGLYYLDPSLHWGWYLGAFALVGTAGHQQLGKQAAIDKIVNSGHSKG